MAIKLSIGTLNFCAACVSAQFTLGCAQTEGAIFVRNHVGGTSGYSSSINPGSGGSGGNGSLGSANVASGGVSNRPSTDVKWQVQLTGAFDASVDAALYYVDLDNVANSELTALANSGRHIACYFSAGTFEPWRADADAFPDEVLGNSLADYPNERWLDIRSSALRTLMYARLDRLKSAGCNSIVIANVTTSGEDPGFDVTAADQTNYLLDLSTEIHRRSLLAALATADDRLAQVEPYFDWAYAQSCWSDGQCSAYAPFVVAKKAVLAVEFGDSTNAATLCQGVAGSGINLLVKPEGLSASRIACLP